MNPHTEYNADDIAARFAAVHERIARAELRYGRAPGSVGLLAFSKQQPAAIIAAAHATGQRAFGENYLQEALPKLAALAHLGLTWHYTGALQANKTQTVARHFAWVHSVDRLTLAERLNAQRPADLPPLDVCIQVNVGGEAQKAGVDPAPAAALARIRLRGLGAGPPAGGGGAARRRGGRRGRGAGGAGRRRGRARGAGAM